MLKVLDEIEPQWDTRVVSLVDNYCRQDGKDYLTVLMFGLYNVGEAELEARLYAGFRHLREHPRNGAALLEVTRILVELKRHEEARQILAAMTTEQDLDLYPQIFCENIEAQLALVYADAGNFPDAMKLLDALEETHGDLPILHYLKASLFHSLALFPQAVIEYESALELLRAGAVAGDIGEDVDVEAVGAYISRRMKDAEDSRPFAGIRTVEMSSLLEI